jgi:SSS family solute:Na+ symporter
MNLQLVLLAAYSIALVAIGLWVGRAVKSTRDFFVAGRRLPAFLVFATVLAANIGAGSTVGAASLGYRDGLGAWWWNGSAGIGSVLLALWIGPRLWREARRHEFLTLGDFLEHRYGRAVRGIVGVLLWLVTPFILAGQIIGAASILGAVAGVPRAAGATAAVAVMLVYFVAGGLLSSAWVNLVELVVLLVGFAIAAPLALGAAGGLEAVASAPHVPAGFTSMWQGPGSLAWLALLGPAFIVSPGLIQKAYGAIDERAIQIGIGASGAALMLFGFVPPLIGMAARVLHPDLASVDLALPMVLAHDLPPAAGSLALAAVLSAEISSADAILFMLATSLSQDLYRRFIRPDATDRTVLRVARGAAAAGAVIAFLLAIVLPTVVDALRIFYSVLTVVLFVPVVAALHSRRAGRLEALSSIAAGVSTMLLVAVTAGDAGIGGWSPAQIGLIASGLAFGGVLFVARPRASHP